MLTLGTAVFLVKAVRESAQVAPSRYGGPDDESDPLKDEYQIA